MKLLGAFIYPPITLLTIIAPSIYIIQLLTVNPPTPLSSLRQILEITTHSFTHPAIGYQYHRVSDDWVIDFGTNGAAT
jgi:hypothetical protein